MSYMINSPLCKRKVLQNPKRSVYQDEDLSYVQPTRASPVFHDKHCKKSNAKIERNTTYSLSYRNHDNEYHPPKKESEYERCRRLAKNVTGKFDFNTMYKLSYHNIPMMEVRKPFTQRAHLSMNGEQETLTTQKLSYGNPGCVKTELCEPYRGKTQLIVPMERTTVMKESYQDFGSPTIIKPAKRQFWQTKHKTNYQTTNHLSYQYVEPCPKRSRVSTKPKISAQIEKNTTYNMSYQIPGCFVPKNSPASA